MKNIIVFPDKRNDGLRGLSEAYGRDLFEVFVILKHTKRSLQECLDRIAQGVCSPDIDIIDNSLINPQSEIHFDGLTALFLEAIIKLTADKVSHFLPLFAKYPDSNIQAAFICRLRQLGQDIPEQWRQKK